MSSLSKKHSTYFRTLIWLVPLGLLWLALRDIPWKAVTITLLSLNPLSLLGLVLVNAAILVLFAGRWWLILRSQGYTVPILPLVGYRLVAFGVSYFTPGPQLGGEPLQVVLAQRRQNLTTTVAISSVTLDKLVEIQANFTFLSIGLAVLIYSGKGPQGLSWPVGLTATSLFALPLFYILALRSGRRPLAWLGARLRNLQAVLSRFDQATRAINRAEAHMMHFCQRHPRTILAAWMVSIFTWAMLVLEYWLALRILGLQLDYIGIVLVMTMARLAFLLPVPGGLGTLEAGQVLSMQALGLSPTYGLSLSLLIHGRDLILGGFGLWLGSFLAARTFHTLAPVPIGEELLQGFGSTESMGN